MGQCLAASPGVRLPTAVALTAAQAGSAGAAANDERLLAAQGRRLRAGAARRTSTSAELADPLVAGAGRAQRVIVAMALPKEQPEQLVVLPVDTSGVVETGSGLPRATGTTRASSEAWPRVPG